MTITEKTAESLPGSFAFTPDCKKLSFLLAGTLCTLLVK